LTKILVIEDDPAMRRMIVRTLAAAGHEMIEAKDGQEGLSHFRVDRPTLVITDVLMPGVDGLETIRALRGYAPRVAIIAISGGGSTQNMSFLDFAKKLGADAVIEKPFRARDLVAAVRKLLTP
jgi:DNA-binding response OmpR family regulator